MNKKLILIVEDEVSLSTALRDKLTHESGVDILVASNGEDGLSLSFEKKPDLILLDINMPKMDGLTMLKKIRRDSWGKNVSVILLTNFSDSDKVAEAVNQGAYNYLIKSDWKIQDIVDMIKKLLKDTD